MKLNMDNIKKIYFLGIGGIGMSALARYFHAKGIEIHGYDKTPSSLTDELINEGMAVHFEDDSSLIPDDTDLAVYTPAVPASLKEYEFLVNSGKPILKRSQVTGMITEGKKTVAIAGTHGKTSISSLIAHILMHAGYPVTALIGGISKNYNTNFITSGKEELMIVEADEYDRSFLQLHPDIAVISAMDPDHLDIYGTAGELLQSFSDFARNIKPGGKLIIKDSLETGLNPDTQRIDYAVEERGDIFAYNLKFQDGIQHFDILSCENQFRELELHIPGRHNVENAVAATAVCRALGIDKKLIMEGIKTFSGVRRRFDIRVQRHGLVYIDDYAHHPRELEAFISSVRELYTNKRITGLFQPHLYSRTRDFAEGFARSLDLLDEAWLMEIYPARELPIPGISSRIIFDLINLENKKIVRADEVPGLLKEQKPEVFLTMGAGNIDLLVEPITKILSA